MQVELLNKNQLKDGGFFREWGEISHICYDTPIEKAEKIGRKCLENGHFSGSRATFFKFAIRKITRNLSLQLNRHEIGVVKNQLSQRYVNQTGFEYMMPDGIPFSQEMCIRSTVNIAQMQYELLKEEIEQDEARNILPGGIETAGVYAFTVEALINFMHKRLCNRAQKEIRQLAEDMKDEVLKVVPELKDHLVKACEWNLWCPEGDSCCGQALTRAELMIQLNTMER